MQEEGRAVGEALARTVLLPFLGVLGQETKHYYPNGNRSQVEPTCFGGKRNRACATCFQGKWNFHCNINAMLHWHGVTNMVVSWTRINTFYLSKHDTFIHDFVLHSKYTGPQSAYMS
jgi:hypothetical protein